MATKQGEEVYLSFCIPEEENNQKYSLPYFSEYVKSLNEIELSNSIVNMQGLVTTTDVQGVFVKAKEDSYRVIPGQEFSPIIYRGQNNDYPFMPSSQRYELFDGNERVRHCVDWVKKNEFVKLIITTPYYTRIKQFKVLNNSYEIDMESVAKQYNLVSDYLDVTRNLMVAYFFAYTYYDKEKNRYFPIETFEFNTPYLYCADIRELYYNAPDAIKNMGLQPTIRAKAQQTMSINVANDRDRIKGVFRKIEMPKNPLISRNIYKMFDGGELLFPADYASRCATQITNYKTLQEDLVDKYCDITETDSIWLREELNKLGYELVDQPWNIPEQAKNLVHKEIDEQIIPYLNNGFVLRGIT